MMNGLASRCDSLLTLSGAVTPCYSIACVSGRAPLREIICACSRLELDQFWRYTGERQSSWSHDHAVISSTRISDVEDSECEWVVAVTDVLHVHQKRPLSEALTGGK